jgi:signal transduction histidine kinase/DNA-binding response OmpR family regulator
MPAPKSPDGEAPHILIVDDDPNIRTLLRSLLSRSGYAISEAKSGEEAQEMLLQPRGITFDLIMLDVLMPGLNGFELCQWVRAQSEIAEIPVIFLTALESVNDRVKALESGGDDILTKPFRPADLEARVGTLLRVRHVEAQLRRRNMQLTILSLVSQIIDSQVDTEGLLQQALEQIESLLDTHGAAIWLTQTDETLKLVAKLPQNDHVLEDNIPLDSECLLSQVVRVGRSLPTDGRSERKAQAVCPVSGEPCWCRASDVLTMPLQQRGQVLGVLQVYDKRTGRFSEWDQMLMNSVASVIAAALDNKNLIIQMQENVEQLEYLQQMAVAVNSGLEMVEVLTQVMIWLSRLLPAEAGAVVLLDESRKVLEVTGVIGAANNTSGGEPITWSAMRGVTGRVVHTGQPAILNNVKEDNDYEAILLEPLGVDIQNLLCVPLFYQTETIGVLLALNRQGGSFQEADLTLLSTAAATLATAVGNARLHSQLKDLMIERERRQQQLIIAEKLAATGKLAAGVAHEINNPMQTIRGAIKLSTENINDPERLEIYLEMANEEVDRVIRIVERLRSVYRPGKMETVPIDINKLLTDILVLLNQSLEEHGIESEQELEPDLPEMVGALDQIKQVFLNLMLNAIEAMPNGGLLTVKTKAPPDGIIRVDISDTGEGISEENLQHLFEAFHTTKEKGTGLGLSISYDIIDRHNGMIEVDSISGKGTTFSVILPALARQT